MKIRKRLTPVTSVWLTVFGDLVTNLCLFFLILFITQLLSLQQQKEAYYTLYISGHTDNLPVIKGSPFKTNWELSLMRATSVSKYLQNKFDIDPSRIVSAGYSHYRPLVSHSDEENRAKNRRVEIKIIRE